MKEEKNIEYNIRGIKCDNQKCNWLDKSVKLEDYPNWIDRACPECGENLLTQEDYDEIMILKKTFDFVNTLSEEEMDRICPERPTNEQVIKVVMDSPIMGNMLSKIKFNEDGTMRFEMNKKRGINKKPRDN